MNKRNAELASLIGLAILTSLLTGPLTVAAQEAGTPRLETQPAIAPPEGYIPRRQTVDVPSQPYENTLDRQVQSAPEISVLPAPVAAVEIPDRLAGCWEGRANKPDQMGGPAAAGFEVSWVDVRFCFDSGKKSTVTMARIDLDPLLFYMHMHTPGEVKSSGRLVSYDPRTQTMRVQFTETHNPRLLGLIPIMELVSCGLATMRPNQDGNLECRRPSILRTTVNSSLQRAGKCYWSTPKQWTRADDSSAN